MVDACLGHSDDAVPSGSKTPREFQPITKWSQGSIESAHRCHVSDSHEHAGGADRKDVQPVIELSLISLTRIGFGNAASTASCSDAYLKQFLGVVPTQLLRAEGRHRSGRLAGPE
ncbi:MAG: hypothetical protein Q4F67_17765 [Propionibacteriaceae bacterium]|nr:hypothetical protein [Propionibacteriaceae bacterium]